MLKFKGAADEQKGINGMNGAASCTDDSGCEEGGVLQRCRKPCRKPNTYCIPLPFTFNLFKYHRQLLVGSLKMNDLPSPPPPPCWLNI